jgi:membrane fusion protein (multidrug efflux system)
MRTPRNQFVALALVAGTAVPAAAQSPRPVNVALAPAATAAATPARSQLEKQDIRAQLSPRRFTTLAAELGAKVNRVPVKEGDSFRAGQLLVAFDCSLQQAQLQRIQATLTAAEKTHAANKRLAELNSVGKLEIDTSEAEVAKARADVVLINATLSKCAIAAPFAGRVAEQKVREQQFAQPGQPLLEIIDDSVLELEFIVPSRWLAWLKSGHAFNVRIDETGRSYPARITRIGARVDPVSQSVKAAASIDGRHADLIAGMSGQILIQPPATP